MIIVVEGVRIGYNRSSSHPIEYAITLRVLEDEAWHTIYLVDNAHGAGEHHAHAYVGDEKQPPAIFEGDTNTFMNNAIVGLRTWWREIYGPWKRTR